MVAIFGVRVKPLERFQTKQRLVEANFEKCCIVRIKFQALAGCAKGVPT